MKFWKIVGAYLTGWLIVQPIYNRIYNAWVKRQWVDPSPEFACHMRMQARFNVDEMEKRWDIVARPAGEFSEEELKTAMYDALALAGEPYEPTAPASTPNAIVAHVLQRMRAAT